MHANNQQDKPIREMNRLLAMVGVCPEAKRLILEAILAQLGADQQEINLWSEQAAYLLQFRNHDRG